MNYRSLFLSAMTKNSGKKNADFMLHADCLRKISCDDAARIVSIVYQHATKLDKADIAISPFVYTYFMKELIELHIDIPLEMTFGYIKREGVNYLYTDTQTVMSHKQSLNTFSNMELHCWLTTPAYEIIDLTISLFFNYHIDSDFYNLMPSFKFYNFNGEYGDYIPQVAGDNLMDVFFKP